jgi:hypothetical protein
MNIGEQVLEGLLLGDGGLTKPPYSIFQITASGSAHLSYFTYLKEALAQAGLEFGASYPGETKATSRGKPYQHCYLSSLSSPLTTLLRGRWYPGGYKEVPTDLELSPVVVAHWFMGDGYSGYVAGSTQVILATCSFNENSVRVLESSLLNMGIHTYRIIRKRVKAGSGLDIAIRQSSVDKFMSLVEPWMMAPFLYKVKYHV